MSWKNNLRYKWNCWKKIPYNTYLCLKYPFLYPRNRWDDKHHAWLLHSLLYNTKQKAIREISITGKLEQENKIYHSFANALGMTFNLNKSKKTLTITGLYETKVHDLTKLLWSDDRFEILGFSITFAGGGNLVIALHVKTKDKTDKTNYGFCYEKEELIISKFYYYFNKILNWFDNILDKIFILPTSTELYAMEPGWKKAFGLQMCEEIKQALLKAGGRKMLREYRIMQIKEKWGYLHWYDAWAPQEVHDIISKYENISYNTCICCGKPATKISSGWISPYCDDCYPTYINGRSPIIYQEKINGVWSETNEHKKAWKEAEKINAENKEKV